MFIFGWANQCIEGHDSERSIGDFVHVGQNVGQINHHMSTSIEAVTKTLIELWYAEVRTEILVNLWYNRTCLILKYFGKNHRSFMN